MRAVAVAALLLCASAEAGHKKQSPFTPDAGATKHSSKGTLLINGQKAVVSWSDGDSFRILEGPYAGSGTRLVGYNTLEAYGPVHRWGGWTPQELWEIERGDTAIAAAQEWKCDAEGKLDGYRRLLVNCPDAALELVKQGHAMVYAIEGTRAAPELLEAQKAAQTKKVGIWAKGVPNGIVTSLHSMGEEGGEGDKAYNRVVDTRTGAALKHQHQDSYAVCQEVCVETEGTSSCMVFVPFDRRFKNRADCLKTDAPSHK
jgi:endonuclease YncB( thermonuclease family)